MTPEENDRVAHDLGATFRVPVANEAEARAVYRTRTGRVLSDADVERLATEAERGYKVRPTLASELDNAVLDALLDVAQSCHFIVADCDQNHDELADALRNLHRGGVTGRRLNEMLNAARDAVWFCPAGHDELRCELERVRVALDAARAVK